MRATGTAFASDFDGTLCHSDWAAQTEYFAPEVLEAVRRYQAAGGLFGVCTGRPLHAVTDSVQGVLDLDFYIVTTGAQVIGRNEEVLFERAVDRDVAQDLFDLYAGEDALLVAVTDTSFVSVGGEFGHGVPSVGSLDEVPGTLLGVSFECFGDADRARAIRNDLNRRFANRVEGFQNIGSVDVVAAGCSKGTGVGVVREAFGVSHVGGAGDSFNDLPLLAASDVSYTFTDSPEEVRNAATQVVADLAEALAHFMRG